MSESKKLKVSKISSNESLKLIGSSNNENNESEGLTAELLKNKMNVVLNKHSGLKTTYIFLNFFFLLHILAILITYINEHFFCFLLYINPSFIIYIKRF